MLFNSLHFVVFLPLVVALYFATPFPRRWAVLLAASYYFYGSWRVEYLLLLIASTVVDWIVALKMEQAATSGRRRAWLGVSLAGNLGMLGYFKYAGFLSDALRSAIAPLGWTLPDHAALHPLLPIGISFYVFQTLAYTIDVYRGRIPAARHLGKFALYVSYFPQLVAGPIERADRLMPQLDREHRVDGARIVSGLTRMGWGFFQKLVIADRLAPWVNAAFAGRPGQPASAVVAGAFLFYFQIYTDFSGYTDIAIGSARIMGVELMENFNRAYMATSFSDNWRRWHISLMSWFRHYLLQPLGWSRPGRPKWIRNILLVFVVSGLWHGAAWTFVVWGLANGLLVVVGDTTRRRRDGWWARLTAALQRSSPAAGRALLRARPWMARAVVFSTMALGLILFRAPTLRRAADMFATIVRRPGTLFQNPHLATSHWELVVALAGIAIFLVIENIGNTRNWSGRLAERGRWVQWGVAYAVALAVLAFGELQITEFYYFRF